MLLRFLYLSKNTLFRFALFFIKSSLHFSLWIINVTFVVYLGWFWVKYRNCVVFLLMFSTYKFIFFRAFQHFSTITYRHFDFVYFLFFRVPKKSVLPYYKKTGQRNQPLKTSDERLFIFPKKRYTFCPQKYEHSFFWKITLPHSFKKYIQKNIRSIFVFYM